MRNATSAISETDITYRPPWGFFAFWMFSCAGLLLFGVLVVGRVFPMPEWARCFFIGVPSLALLDGSILSFAVVHVNDEGLMSRHHKKWRAKWAEIEAWSQGGSGGSIYLRTRDGQVRGFSPWCLYGSRCDHLAGVLEQRLGPAATGEAMAAPELLRWLLQIIGK